VAGRGTSIPIVNNGQTLQYLLGQIRVAVYEEGSDISLLQGVWMWRRGGTNEEDMIGCGIIVYFGEEMNEYYILLEMILVEMEETVQNCDIC